MGWLIGVPLAVAWVALWLTLADRPSARQRIARGGRIPRDPNSIWLYPHDQEDYRDDSLPGV